MKKIKHLNSATGYDLYANFYDKKLAFLDSFEQYQLIPNLGEVRDKKILDVGAGTGRLSLRLAEKGANVTAIDVSEEMLNILKEKTKKHTSPSVIPAGHAENQAGRAEIPAIARITFVIANAESLPFPDNSFDIITEAFLIVHLKDLKYFFKEAYRVLKPNGILAITNINQKSPPELKTIKGKIIIESYYHRPEQVIEELEKNLFIINKNILIKDKDVWINQIIIAKK